MKKQKIKKISALFTAVILLAILLLPCRVLASDPLTNYLAGWPQMSDISEESAVLMDADNGGIMYSLDRDVQRYPASITKILTCLLTIENKNMSDQVTMGQEALDVAIDGNSNINPVLGETFTVEQCLYMLMLKSANDVAVQLAVEVAGSVDAFADMMNERAALLGCTGTHFTNPSGLPDENHYTTANDMALIMRECLKNDTFRQIIATTAYTVPATNMTAESRTYENHNRLIDSSSEYYYAYCIGGKTGYTEAAGRTLICVAQKEGRTLIGVTMKGESRQDFSDMVSLFEYGFNNFTKTEKSDGEGVSLSFNLPNGVDESLVTEGDAVTASDGSRISDLIYDGHLKIGEKTTVKAAAGTGQESSSESASPAAEASGETGGKSDNRGFKGIFSKTGGKMRLSVVLAAVLAVAAFIVIVVMLRTINREKRRREEARRRRAVKKRREEMARRRKERR